ncbi:MAG: hypothetical protein WCT85_02805 [Parachlamydiales bacterium]|jgi:hypothetical protein
MTSTSGVQGSSQYPAQLQSSRQSPDQSQKKCDSRVQKIIHYTKENLPELACKVAYVAGVVLFAIGLMKSSVALMTVGGAFFGTAIISTMIHRYIKERAIDKHAKVLFDAAEAFSKVNEFGGETYTLASYEYQRAKKQVEKDLEEAAPRDLIKYITRLSKACPNQDFEIDPDDDHPYGIGSFETQPVLDAESFVEEIIYSKIKKLEKDYKTEIGDTSGDIEKRFFEKKIIIDREEFKKAVFDAASDLANRPKYKVLHKNLKEVVEDLREDLLTFDSVNNYSDRANLFNHLIIDFIA